MIRKGQVGYALVFAIGLIFVSTLAGLAYMKMGTLESGLVTDAESWTQALDTGDAAVQSSLELVRSSEISPFAPVSVNKENQPVWGSYSNQAYIESSDSSSAGTGQEDGADQQRPTGGSFGVHNASVSDLLNLDRFRDSGYSWTASYKKPKSPSGYTANTKFFLSAVGRQPVADRAEARRRIVTFAGLPAGLGRDQAEVAGVAINNKSSCPLDLNQALPLSLPPIPLDGGMVSPEVGDLLYNGQAAAKLDGQGNILFNGLTLDRDPLTLQLNACDLLNPVLQVLGSIPLGSPIQQLASLIFDPQSSTAAGVGLAIPAGLFLTDSGAVRINPYYFTGRSPAESPGIVEYDGNQIFRPDFLSGPGVYPVSKSGTAAIDGGNLPAPYLSRGNVVVVHGNVSLLGAWQNLEKAWGPLTDVTGKPRPTDIVIAADGDIDVDDAAEVFRHVNTGKNTRLVLIAGNDINFTGDLFMTRLNVVAVAFRDIHMRQRALLDGSPFLTSVLGQTSVSIPSLALLPALMSKLSGTLVAGRNIENSVGWYIQFSENVVNGNMSSKPVPQNVVATFHWGTGGFLAMEDPPPAGDLQDLGFPESTVSGGGALKIGIQPGEAVKTPNKPIVPGLTLIKMSHPITGEQAMIPIQGHAATPAIPATRLTPAVPAQPAGYYVTIRVYDRDVNISLTPGAAVANPLTGSNLLKNGSQGESALKTFLIPADWSGHDTLSLTYSSDLVDQPVTAHPDGVTLPPLLEPTLPAASLVVEDLLGRRMVFPLRSTGGVFRTEEVDLRQGFIGEQKTLTGPMKPDMWPYGYAKFDISKVTRVLVRINHAEAAGTVALSSLVLPGNAGAGHNLPFPFHYELLNWQAMIANP